MTASDEYATGLFNADGVEIRSYMPDFCHTYDDDGMPNLPASPTEALFAAALVIEEPERWTQGTWYRPDPAVDSDAGPFTGKWKCCADGALLAVTTGVFRQRDRTQWFASGVYAKYMSDPEARRRYRMYREALDLVNYHVPPAGWSQRSALSVFNDQANQTCANVAAMMRRAGTRGEAAA